MRVISRARRRVTEGKKEMSRLYVIETTPTTTGAAADHHWAVKPSELLAIAQSIGSLLSLEADLRAGCEAASR